MTLRLILCNCPPSHAMPLAEKIVEKRLGACVNIAGPIQSVYRWDGALQSETELTLQIKTTAERYSELVNFLETEHPYDLPEIIGVDLPHVSAAYGNWVIQETTDA